MWCEKNKVLPLFHNGFFALFTTMMNDFDRQSKLLTSCSQMALTCPHMLLENFPRVIGGHAGTILATSAITLQCK